VASPRYVAYFLVMPLTPAASEWMAPSYLKLTEG
jgi:hypothetical protein